MSDGHRSRRATIASKLFSGDHRVSLAALIVGSILFQLTLLVPNARLSPQADEIQYLHYSRSIQAGKGLPGSLRPPVHPYAVALARTVAPRGTPPRLAVGVLQIIASAITMGLIYLLAQELFDRRSGLVAAAIFGFYPTIAAHTHLLWSDSLTLLPLVASLLLSVRAQKSGRPLTALAAGAAFGLTALTREFAFWFIPVVAVWLAVSSGIGRRRTLAACLVVAGALLVILPWTVRNYRVHDEVVLIAANSWSPLYLANNMDKRQWLAIHHYRDYRGRDVERERFARKHALNTIASRQPGWIFDRLAISVPALLSVENFSLRHFRFGWYGDVSHLVKVLAVITMTTSYLALLACFALGVTATRWNAGRLLVLLFMLYAASVIVPFPTVSRYRLPLEALATPFAAAWLSGAEATRGRSGRGPHLYVGMAIAASLIALSFVTGAGRIAEILSLQA